MFLSVIIPTYNREPLLSKVLESLSDQRYPNNQFEVIVIDNGSTDNTKNTCTNYISKIRNLKYVYDGRPGLHVGRHVGLENASGDILVFGDDDIRAFPSWLEGVSESFNDPEVGLVGGKCIPDFESVPPVWVDYLWKETTFGKVLGQYSLLDFGDEVKEISPFYVWGCNFSIRKEILLECGGFHPDSMPGGLLRFRGDGETAVSSFVFAQGYKTIYNPKSSVYHLVSNKRMTLDYLYYRSYLQGISDSYTTLRSCRGICKFGNFKNLLKVIVFRLMHYARNSLLLYSMESRIMEAVKSGYLDGYLFHQREVVKDKELLGWVMRINYMGHGNDIENNS